MMILLQLAMQTLLSALSKYTSTASST